MSELPQGWAYASLQELSGIGGLVTDGDWIESKDQDPTGAVRLIQLMDVGDGEFRDRSERFLTPEAVARLGCTLLNENDLLIARMPDPLGRACLFPGVGQEAVTAVDVLIWRAGEHCAEPRWLMHFINSPHVRSEIGAQASGTTRQRVAGGRLKALQLPVPPISEQRRIAAKLDSLFARTKTARIELARIPLLINHYKQAVLRKAFAGELTADWREKAGEDETAAELVARTPAPSQSRGGREATSNLIEGTAAISVNNPGTPLPQRWEWVSLRRIARQETGHTPSRSKPEWWGGDICWIGIKDASLHHGWLIHDTIQKTNELGLENSSARLLPAGTVCLSRTASVGYVTIMGREMATSQDFATWTCTSALIPKYLMYALMSEGEEIRRFGQGSTHTTIYFPEIRAFHIKLAPLKEQQEIVTRIEQSYAQIDRLAEESGKATHLFDHLDRGLLTKAFRGELVQQDPNDEPASALLERIRKQRPKHFHRHRRRKAPTEQAV